jgi:aromatic-L-amino-acid/L-tryptophan decarboxylase
MSANETTNHAFSSEALASTRDPSPLQMDADTFYHLGLHAVELAADYLETLPDKPVYRPMTPSERHLLLHQALPEFGRSPEALFDFFEQHILPHAMGNQHPRFAAWVNPAAAPIGMLAEFLAAVMNPSAAGGDHAAIYLEHCVIRWLMELIGFPTDGSAGLLVGGGSVASLYCLAVARQWAAARNGWNMREEGLQGQHPRLVLYVSEEGHSCLRKASHLLGLGEPHRVPVDASFKMNLSALRKAVASDRAEGWLPFCVAASAGTVNTGAVDPLADLAEFCHEQGLWLHVDGAYGAFGILDPQVSPLFSGLERADSVALDPHKWLATPIECSCAIVRAGELLRETFSLVPPYLRTEPGKGFGGLPWFSEYGFQQTRRFNALKLLWVIQQAGRTGLIAHVTRHNTLAQYMASLIDAAPDLERMAPVELSIVCFRSVPDHLHGEEEQLDALNKRIMEEMQIGGKAFVNGTLLYGRFVLRACALHYALTEADVEAIVQEVQQVGERCLAQSS